MNRRFLAGCTFGLAALMAAPSAAADIIIFKNKRELKGIVERLAGDSTKVRFIGANGTSEFPLANIERIIEEPRAQGLLHIGDEFRDRRDDLRSAIAKYREAAALDPDFAPARERIAEVQAEMVRRSEALRIEEIEDIDVYMGRVRQAIARGAFEEAEAMVADADRLRPTLEQGQMLQDILVDLYVAWARERIDKQNGLAAERKLELALAIDPRDDEVIDMMLALWRGNDSRKAESLRVLEMKLQREPTNSLLRREVGDLYFDQRMFREAALHYLQLYEGSRDAYANTGFERKIADTLENLHRQYAMETNWDEAIYFFKLLQTIDLGADPFMLNFYEYQQEANARPGLTAEAKIHLAQFAASRPDLDYYAIENYKGALAMDPENEQARAAIGAYAMRRAAEAQAYLRNGELYRAMGMRNTIEREFPQAQEALLIARQVSGQAEIELQKEARSRRQAAVQYVEQGDRDFQQALAFYNNIFDTQQQQNLAFSRAKPDSTRYFGYAIQNYETALSIDASLANDPGAIVRRKIDDANRYLSRLTARPRQTGIYPRRTVGVIPPRP